MRAATRYCDFCGKLTTRRKRQINFQQYNVCGSYICIDEFTRWQKRLKWVRLSAGKR